MKEPLVCPGCGAADGITDVGPGEHQCAWCKRRFRGPEGPNPARSETQVAQPTQINVTTTATQLGCAECGRTENLRKCSVCGNVYCGFHRSRVNGKDTCERCAPRPKTTDTEPRKSGWLSWFRSS
jgi:hypothetical protein